MKKAIVPALAIGVLSLMAFTGIKLHTDVYKVDVKKSSMEWYAAKVTGKHNGTILFSGGEINSTHGTLSGTFEIDMNTIEDKDLADATYKAKLENHLKSPDFFDVAKYPKSKFVLTSATPAPAGNKDGFTHKVKGMLTIKDKTNEISFDAIIKFEGGGASCTGSAIVDRSKFDVKYGSKTFYESIGDKMIYDEFTLKFNVVAAK